MAIPDCITNELDWRLFHELAAQADVMLSSGRYLRDRAQGNAQEILAPDDQRFDDLKQWRIDRDLPPLPAIAVISASLDFPVPDELVSGDRDVIVVTCSKSDEKSKTKIRDKGITVIEAGEQLVCGRELVDGLTALGHRVIYSAAGPRILHMLLAANVLHRLYTTVVMRAIGGESYASMVKGATLKTPSDMQLLELYLDQDGARGASQMFISYAGTEPAGEPEY